MPSATAIGDVWVDTNDSNKMYFAVNANAGLASAGRTPSNWILEDFASVVNSNTTTIDGGKITANSVTATQILANTITANQIAANAITADEIDANAITGKNILIGDLTVNTSTGAVTGGEGFKAIGTGTGAGIVSMGDATTNIIVNPSSGLLTLNGNVVSTANINSEAITQFSISELSSVTSISGTSDVTVLTVSITGLSSAHKLLICMHGGIDPGFTGGYQGGSDNTAYAKVKLNGTVVWSELCTGVAGGSSVDYCRINFTAVKAAANGTNTVILVGQNPVNPTSTATKFMAGSGLYMTVVKR